MWFEVVKAKIQNQSKRHINAKITPSNGPPRKYTGFYGHSEASKRKETWSIFRHLNLFKFIQWICAGDFNEIIDLTEKSGGNGRLGGVMEYFKNTLVFCKLHDLGYRGPKYKWNYGREGGAFTQERLDSVTANKAWCELYTEVDISMKEAISSNHSPLVLVFHGRDNTRRHRRGFWIICR
jgi:hypothetical protein